MSDSKRLSMFDAFGIEVEYMLVDRETLNVRPVADRVLQAAAGRPASDIEFGDATYSNELALHVIELKGTNPATDLDSLAESMRSAIAALRPSLDSLGVMMMPTGMHPWMNPQMETRLWPHEYREIYQAYHDIFDCHRHGWANVQSVHLNLPFDGDEQFARLHAAIRLVLAILPAITASSPIVDAKPAAWADMRMNFVLDHCSKLPFLTGDMIPEPIFDEATYIREIFGGLKDAIEPFNSTGIFDPNFLNLRGAIARFDRGSIEIRVMDVQEYPAADIAVCELTIKLLKAMVAETFTSLKEQQRVPTATLANWLKETSEKAEATVIDDPNLLVHFGINEDSITAAELWQTLASSLGVVQSAITPILEMGSLSTRILKAVGTDWRREHLQEVYRRLSDCLSSNHAFTP